MPTTLLRYSRKIIEFNLLRTFFSGVKNESVLGKTIVEAYGNTNDSPIPKAIAGVATTGVEFDFGEITYGDDNIAKVKITQRNKIDL